MSVPLSERRAKATYSVMVHRSNGISHFRNPQWTVEATSIIRPPPMIVRDSRAHRTRYLDVASDGAGGFELRFGGHSLGGLTVERVHQISPGGFGFTVRGPEGAYATAELVHELLQAHHSQFEADLKYRLGGAEPT